MSDFVKDYELGQVAIRHLGGWPVSAPIDPALAESVGRELRPVLTDAAEAFTAAWKAVPWHVRLRLRFYAWANRRRQTHE